MTYVASLENYIVLDKNACDHLMHRMLSKRSSKQERGL